LTGSTSADPEPRTVRQGKDSGWKHRLCRRRRSGVVRSRPVGELFLKRSRRLFGLFRAMLLLDPRGTLVP
jgi:hypothetical protein